MPTCILYTESLNANYHNFSFDFLPWFLVTRKENYVGGILFVFSVAKFIQEFNWA